MKISDKILNQFQINKSDINKVRVVFFNKLSDIRIYFYSKLKILNSPPGVVMIICDMSGHHLYSIFNLHRNISGYIIAKNTELSEALAPDLIVRDTTIDQLDDLLNNLQILL